MKKTSPVAPVISVRQVPSGYAEMQFSTEHLQHSVNARLFIKRYARIMDRRGADALLGLLGPMVDVGLGVTHSLVTVYRAHQVNLPRSAAMKILARHGADVAIGFIPIVGDLLDFGVRSNLYAQEQFAMHHDAMLQMMIEQGVEIDADHATHSGSPSERYQHRSIEGIRSQIEKHIDKLVSTHKAK